MNQELINKLIDDLKLILDKNFFSIYEIATQVGVSHNTMHRVLDENNKTPLRAETLRKIRIFVDNYKG